LSVVVSGREWKRDGKRARGNESERNAVRVEESPIEKRASDTSRVVTERRDGRADYTRTKS
jgi:hypothetical protein